MADFLTNTKAQALAVALEQATGEQPIVQDMGNYIRVYWGETQYPAIRQRIEKMISKKEPGNIRVEWIPVVAPIALKKVAPIALALIGAGYLLGKL